MKELEQNKVVEREKLIFDKTIGAKLFNFRIWCPQHNKEKMGAQQTFSESQVVPKYLKSILVTCLRFLFRSESGSAYKKCL